MFVRNEDIRKAKGNIPAWVIAERLGIHENSFFRLLRREIPANKKTQILKIINDIKEELKSAEMHK